MVTDRLQGNAWTEQAVPLYQSPGSFCHTAPEGLLLTVRQTWRACILVPFIPASESWKGLDPTACVT